MFLRLSLLLVALVTISSTLKAESIVVVIENTQALDGFFFTPVWVAAHDGSFDSYSSGEPASNFAGLELLAEAGDTSALSANFAGSPAGLAGGLDATVTATNIAIPVFSPGEASTFILDIGDPTINRYFSYASMLIPSNDLFFANGNPLEHAIFDSSGQFNGTQTIEIFANDLIDCGTELNDIAGGAAFSGLGGLDADESENIQPIFLRDPNAIYLSSIIGSETANGSIVNSALESSTMVARITIKQEPTPKLRVLVENLQPSGGIFTTPMWVAAHDGNFDVWSSGEMASAFPGLEAIAEEGDASGLDMSLQASSSGAAGATSSTITALDIPIPVFSPGETASFDLSVMNPSINRFFSYASMIIPSNDLFVANSLPTQYELFDANGEFNGPVTIEIRGGSIVDAGTEANSIADGAAFSALGGTGISEALALADLSINDPSGSYLASIVGTPTAAGTDIGSVPTSNELVLRITIEEVMEQEFIRGDVDSNSIVNLTDVVVQLTSLFGAGATISCERSLDINDSNSIDLADPILLLTYLFAQGAPPAAPFPNCGADTSPDLLDCNDFAACP